MSVAKRSQLSPSSACELPPTSRRPRRSPSPIMNAAVDEVPTLPPPSPPLPPQLEEPPFLTPLYHPPSELLLGGEDVPHFSDDDDGESIHVSPLRLSSERFQLPEEPSPPEAQVDAVVQSANADSTAFERLIHCTNANDDPSSSKFCWVK